MNHFVGITALGLVTLSVAYGTHTPGLNLPSVTLRECSGPTTTITLDGRSFVNLSGDVQFHWQLAQGSVATIEDAYTAEPRITFAMHGSCEVSTALTLIVRSGQRFARATTQVIVRDTTPPLIECPEDLVITDDTPTEPYSTGVAKAFDDRAGNVDVTYTDDLSIEGTIVRTWSASDGCQSSTAVQTLTVLPAVSGPHFDIKPGSCPNPINVGESAAEEVANVPTALLGNAFDVTSVDLDSVRLVRPVGANMAEAFVPVFPIQLSFNDTGTPFLGVPCDCHALGADGKVDLVAHFDRLEVIQAFGLDQELDGTLVRLELRWSAKNGSARYRASDCVRVNHH